MPASRKPSPLTVAFGHDELVISNRYEVVSIINDILIAMWFIVGSILFFSEATTTAGTWLFLIGSLELAVRPVIRLSRYVHLRRIRPPEYGPANQSDQDF